MTPSMIEIFNGDEYRIYIDDDVMAFRPKTVNGNVLLLPPPGVSLNSTQYWQFYLQN